MVVEDGLDLYGLDLLIDLIYDLRKDGINAGLLFCLPEIGNKNIMRSFRKELRIIIKRVCEDSFWCNTKRI